VAVTLAQAAVDEGVDPKTRALIEMFAYYSPVMSEIPMDSIDTRWYEYERQVSLPATGFRAYNQAWPESTGVTNPEREYAKILGGESKIDVQLLRSQRDNGARMKSRQTQMKVQSIMNTWDSAFFEGTILNEPNGFVGLRPRITGSQLIQNGSAGVPAPLTLSKLRALIDSVPFSSKPTQGMKRGSGVKKLLYMSRAMRTKIDALIEAQTGSLRIETSRDEFNDFVERYGDAQIRVVEQTGDGSTILGYDEDAGNGSPTSASIYCVAFGEGLCHGFRNTANGQLVDRFEVDQMETEPRWMMRFEGQYGIALDHPRCASRLYGISAA
jgi:putative hemolysin